MYIYVCVYIYIFRLYMDFPCGSVVKQCRRPGFNPWVGKIPWRRERLPTPVLWPREFHGLYSPGRCRVGYN